MAGRPRHDGQAANDGQNAEPASEKEEPRPQVMAERHHRRRAEDRRHHQEQRKRRRFPPVADEARADHEQSDGGDEREKRSDVQASPHFLKHPGGLRHAATFDRSAPAASGICGSTIA